MATRASAPGKVILFGEHAVVYGRPALAVPVTQVSATATVQAAEAGLVIDARSLNRRYRLSEAGPNDVLATAVNLTLARVGARTPPAVALTVESSIPMASGLGSGAAVCAAVVRALSEYLGCPLSDAEVSALVFETETMLHGTPSGIDNTVIAFRRPVYFVKGQPPVPFQVAHPFRLLIADTGLPCPTRIAVADVRAAYEREPERYTRLFDAIGAIARQARALIETGSPTESEAPDVDPVSRDVGRALAQLGSLMNRNHEMLREIGVSSPELERLVSSALAADALGAKLSGAGRGGNMLALVTDQLELRVRDALERAGAKRVIGTVVGN